jgi:hypothetical protein
VLQNYIDLCLFATVLDFLFMFAHSWTLHEPEASHCFAEPKGSVNSFHDIRGNVSNNDYSFTIFKKLYFYLDKYEVKCLLERAGSSVVGRGLANHDQQHCYHHAPTVKS